MPHDEHIHGPLIRDIEARWNRPEIPDLRAILADLPHEDESAWAAALVADAECRAEREIAPTLEHYLEQFPWLPPGSQAVQEILAVEIGFHSTSGRTPATESAWVGKYGERFLSDIRLVLELLGTLEPSATREPLAPERRLGKYTLRQILGRGSFGEVWLAWDEELARATALKLITPSGDLERRAASLMGEARAASGLAHPNVVGVRAAGRFAPPDDWLYIDMEVCGDPAPTAQDPRALAIGTPLRDLADRFRSDWRAAARIMADICRGVVAAHAQGVVHCDLKPANVLVTPSGRAMVADFGLSASSFLPVANADAASADATVSVALRTQNGQMIRGTPAYMSPEQARGEKAKPISDVYGLGAVLYFLLTGSDPSRSSPGQTLTQLLARLGDPAEPNPSLPRGAHPTLARICTRAMAKRPDDRYASASALQADLEALLNRRVPPTAGPDMPLQPLTLWARRNALPVSITAAAMLGLATLSVVALALRSDAERQRDRAAAESTRADERAEAATKAEAAATAARDAEKERADQLKKVSDFQSQMLSQINTTQAGIDLMADVRERFVAALEKAGVPEAERATRVDALRQELIRVNATDAAAAMIDRTILKPAIKTIDDQFTDDPTTDASLRQALADLYYTIGRYDAAFPLQESALATRRRVLEEEHPDTLRSISQMGVLLQTQGKFAEAEPYYREALEKRRRLRGEEHPDTLTSINNMGFLLQSQGKLSEAEPYYRELLERRRRVYGEEHPDTLTAINNMGGLLLDQGKFSEAEPYWRDALERSRRVLGEEHPDTLITVKNLGFLLGIQGKSREAERYYHEALEKQRRVLGEEHPSTIGAISNYGEFLTAQRRFSEAEPFVREAVEKAARVLGEEHRQTLTSINNLGVLLDHQGKPVEAERYYRETLARRRRVLGEEHPDTLVSVNNLGNLLHNQGSLFEAEPYVRELVEKASRVFGAEHPNTLHSINNMGGLLQAQGKLAEAEPYLREALEKRRRVLGEEHPDTQSSAIGIAQLLERQQKFPDAEVLWRQLLATRTKALPPTDWRIANTKSRLGGALLGQSKFVEAEPMLVSGYEGLAASPDTPRKPQDRLAEGTQRLVDLYTAWHAAEPGKGYDAKAAEWKAKLPPPEPVADQPQPGR